MKWIGKRVTFVDNKDNISFVIYPPSIGKKRIVMLVWLALYLFAGFYVSLQFFKDYSRDEKLVLFIFMAFWLYFAVRVIRSIIYLYYGREYIKLDANSLRIKQATGKYGQVKQYFIENITKLSVEAPKDNTFKKIYEDSPWVAGSNRIQFEYYGKIRSFGRKLDEKDAEMIFKIITKRIEKFLHKK